MENVEQRVRKIIAEQLGVNEGEIKNESSFVDDLGADSLDTVELVMALEEEFETEIPDEEAEKITTVQQAVDYIKANAKVAENLYRKATGDGREAVTAAIFWLKTRASWKETSISEITHDVADPVRGLMQRIAEKGARLHDRD